MAAAADSDRLFRLIVHGTLESSECLSAGSMYCRSTLVLGRDWSHVVQGGDRANTVDVITQLAERKPGADALFTWNAPFEFVLESPTPASWPQIAIAATSIGADGKDVVIGYARCHVPRKPGCHSLTLPMLQPVYSTPQHQLFGMFSGKPELRDPTFLCSVDDHAFLNASAVPGNIKVSFHVALSNFAQLGFH